MQEKKNKIQFKKKSASLKTNLNTLKKLLQNQINTERVCVYVPAAHIYIYYIYRHLVY